MNISLNYKCKDEYSRAKDLFKNIKNKIRKNNPEILIEALEYYYKKLTIDDTIDEITYNMKSSKKLIDEVLDMFILERIK